MKRPRYYRLRPDHSVEPVDVGGDDKVTALLAWAAEVWGDGDGRRVALTVIAPGVEVSTVFLGIDHNHSAKGPPLLFETMTFDDYGGGETWRYSTWKEAVAGHNAAVSILRAKLVKGLAVDILGKPKP
jgi:hypothetical protein